MTARAVAESHGGSVLQLFAADRLGVARNTVYSWLSAAGIDVQALRR